MALHTQLAAANNEVALLRALLQGRPAEPPPALVPAGVGTSHVQAEFTLQQATVVSGVAAAGVDLVAHLRGEVQVRQDRAVASQHYLLHPAVDGF
jgi:hypothetical protein